MKVFLKIKRPLVKILYELNLFVIGNIKSYYYSFNNKLLENNESLANKYKSGRIFIFFSGRSINDIDLSVFKNEYTMGVNFVAIHPEFSKINANFYCYTASWSNSGSKYLAWGLHTVYTSINKNTKLILNTSSLYWIKNFDFYGIKDYYKKFSTYYINKNHFIPSSKNGVNCNLPLSTRGVFSRSIGIAIDMGFNEIYLVGADYAKSPLYVGHCYGSENTIEKPTNELIDTHKKIKEFAKENQVNIINVISGDQKSKVFDSIDIKDIYIKLK